jgi:hypothetical protein
MQYSPKLKMAMQEIQEILNKNNIAGFVVLHTAALEDGNKQVEGFSEYLLQIDKPFYSALELKPNGTGYIVKGKSSHYGSKEDRDFAMAATQNMLTHISQVAGRLVLTVMQLETQVNNAYGKGDHDSGTQSGHTQQNN